MLAVGVVPPDRAGGAAPPVQAPTGRCPARARPVPENAI